MKMRSSVFILLTVFSPIPALPQQIPAQNFAGRPGSRLALTFPERGSPTLVRTPVWSRRPGRWSNSGESR